MGCVCAFRWRIRRRVHRRIRQHTRWHIRWHICWQCAMLRQFVLTQHFIDMVWVSKTAIQCPSSICNFAYIASSPDPAGRLRAHFNNIKVRDAEHESYFQKPFCVLCGDVISSKTRKGLWKSDMNKHWLVTHSAEFAESVDRNSKEERVMRISHEASTTELTRCTGHCAYSIAVPAGKVVQRMASRVHPRRG